MSFSKLSADLIIAEAIQLLQEEGLSGVSLRKVAKRLDASVSSLYWHVKDREALYTLMSGRIFRKCVEEVPACSNWEDWLKAFGMSLWQAQVDIPDIQKLILQARPDNETLSALRMDLIGQLTRLGADADQAAFAQTSVQALVTGWTTLGRNVAGREGAREIGYAIEVLIEGIHSIAAKRR
ncbi:TetR family transcriptional regulator [Altericroceibacterium spongiae]|uniref:TetR family transcriptional regulator n=1 Tax=Altericroceibacterium spongiae TaxID=2320269 RepID=A0A420EKR6_9SPHN|nr:TetR family transcriptional regulator [Altericroceibacterium spongiae]RKF21240.1 TetR family transcriptional regulator [Altericroceibacterium spongiae]